MKNKSVIYCLFALLVMVMIFGIYQVYAFLTQDLNSIHQFEIDEINATVEVTGQAEVETIVTNSDLAYIHYIDDFILDKYGLLDTMSSELKVKISFNNNFPTRVKVKVPELIEGLCYIVIDDTNDTIDLDLNLVIENGVLKKQYINADGTFSALTDIVDMNELSESSTNAEFRDVINNYNQTKLESLYMDDNNSFTGEEVMNFRILVWGDYYSLSDATTYLTNQYKLKVEAKVIQDIKYYGGTLDYEND